MRVTTMIDQPHEIVYLISTSWIYTSAKSRICRRKSDQGEELTEISQGGDALGDE